MVLTRKQRIWLSLLMSVLLVFGLVLQPVKASAVAGIDDLTIAAVGFLIVACGVSFVVGEDSNADAVYSYLKGALEDFGGDVKQYITDPVINGLTSTGTAVLSWEGWNWLQDFVSNLVSQESGDVEIAIDPDNQLVMVDGVAIPFPREGTADNDGQYLADLLLNGHGIGFGYFTPNSTPGTYKNEARNLEIYYSRRSTSCDPLKGDGFSFSAYLSSYKGYGYVGTSYGGSIGISLVVVPQEASKPIEVYSIGGTTFTSETASTYWDAYDAYTNTGALPSISGDVAVGRYEDFVGKTDRVLNGAKEGDSPMVYAPDVLDRWAIAGDLDAQKIWDAILDGTLTGDTAITGVVDKEGVMTDVETGDIVGTLTPDGVIPGQIADTPAIDMDDVQMTPDEVKTLGEAFTQTFPFSIPWDFVRCIKLLVAPAAPPKWEVDFLAPVAHRVGGWQGSTTITIDFAQFETLGALCRWTSTVGFCLALVMVTKRLIWPA